MNLKHCEDECVVKCSFIRSEQFRQALRRLDIDCPCYTCLVKMMCDNELDCYLWTDFHRRVVLMVEAINNGKLFLGHAAKKKTGLIVKSTKSRRGKN